MISEISVVVPCYNDGEYIERCLLSIIHQEYLPFEIIVVNDGSTDNTLDVCNKLAEKHSLIKIYNQKNQGVSLARNFGIEKATGDKIVFVDADDFVEENLLEALVSSCKHPNELCISGFTHIKGDLETKNKNYQKLIKECGYIVNKTDFLQLLAKDAMSSPCCKLYEVNIIKQHSIRFDKDLSYQEDLIFNLQYFKHIDSVKLVDDFSYHYIEYSNSSTSNYHKNIDLSFEYIFEETKNYEGFKKHEGELREFLVYQLLRVVQNYAHGKSNSTVCEKISKLNRLFESDEFNFCKQALATVNINFLLKFLILNKKSQLLTLYFRMRKFAVRFK